jgi:hypothetical protein
VTCFVNIRISGKPTTGDVLKLYRAYHSDNPPPVVHLRAGHIMDSLLRDVFLKMGNNHNEKIFLLAYASCTLLPSIDEVDTSSEITSISTCQNNLKSFGI